MVSLQTFTDPTVKSTTAETYFGGLVGEFGVSCYNDSGYLKPIFFNIERSDCRRIRMCYKEIY